MKTYQQKNRIAWKCYSIMLMCIIALLPDIKAIVIFAMCYGIFELGLHWYIAKLRSHFQWLITAKDKTPSFSAELLNKFFADGFDPLLGWSRKPNTSKQEMGKHGPTQYHINAKGQRANPSHEHLPVDISTYGDSFTFCRQVNDDETFQFHLSKLTNTNVVNYGVGNYGLDQAYLRMQREFPSNRSRIVILGVVPSTIVRIQSIWKHYSEFGNILAFKPRFVLADDKTLKLIPNVIDTREKFQNYQAYLASLNENDAFYGSKFLAEMLTFPYCRSLLKAPKRHFTLLWHVTQSLFFGRQQSHQRALDAIMQTNLALRQKLFRDHESLQLLNSMLESFINYAKQQEFTPILMWMPQKDDILSIRSQGHFYQAFIDSAKQRMNVIDLTDVLLKVDNIDELYSDDSHYGGHLSKEGNKLVANEIYYQIKNVTSAYKAPSTSIYQMAKNDAQTV